MQYHPLSFYCFQEYSPDLTIALWAYTQGNGDMTILSNGIRTSATIGMFENNGAISRSFSNSSLNILP